MTSDEKEGIGLMKYSVIVPLINGSWDSEKSNKAFLNIHSSQRENQEVFRIYHRTLV